MAKNCQQGRSKMAKKERMRLKMKFNKDTQIGEIIMKAPEKADILMEAGMHCLGCPASQIETLEEACEVHGIDVQEVLDKLNEEEEK